MCIRALGAGVLQDASPSGQHRALRALAADGSVSLVDSSSPSYIFRAPVRRLAPAPRGSHYGLIQPAIRAHPQAQGTQNGKWNKRARRRIGTPAFPMHPEGYDPKAADARPPRRRRRRRRKRKELVMANHASAEKRNRAAHPPDRTKPQRQGCRPHPPQEGARQRSPPPAQARRYRRRDLEQPSRPSTAPPRKASFTPKRPRARRAASPRPRTRHDHRLSGLS